MGIHPWEFENCLHFYGNRMVFARYSLPFFSFFCCRAKKLGEKLSVYKLGSDSNFLERLRKNLFSEYLSAYIKYVSILFKNEY